MLITSWFGVSVSEDLWIFIELIPVFLAFVVIVVLGRKASSSGNKLSIAFAIWCSILLIIAQSGWITAHLNQVQFFKSIFDNVWTIFNTSVMLSFLLMHKRN